MAELTLKRRDDGIAELSFNDWMALLGAEAKLHDERVVALAGLGKDNVLRVSKAQWHRGFKGCGGLICGKGNELRPGGTPLFRVVSSLCLAGSSTQLYYLDLNW